MDEHADPVPRNGRCRKAWGFSPGNGDVGLARFDHLNRFRIGIPQDIEIGPRVGFFKGTREGFDGRQFRSVADNGQAPGDVRKGDKSHSPAEQKAKA